MVAALFLAAVPAVADLYFRAYGPRGALMVRKPELTWEVWADDAKSITGFDAELNGQEVPCRYDPDRRRVVATIDALEPGHYQAAIRVHYQGGNTHSKEWTFDVRPDALPALDAPNEDQKAAIVAANDLRRKMGLGEFVMDDRVNAASLAHAKYLEANSAFGHEEIPGKPGFVGKTHRERLEAFGYVGTAAENIAFGSDSAADAIAGLIDAPYHRMALLQPGKLQFGCGKAGKVLAMACATSETPAVVMYPYDGQVGVPTAWSKPEVPDPLAIHNLSGKKVGYVVSFAVTSSSPVQVRFDETRLQTAAGAEVPVLVNTPINDKNLTREAFLIPASPLAPNTEYVATVKVVVDRPDGPDTIAKTWRFKTGR